MTSVTHQANTPGIRHELPEYFFESSYHTRFGHLGRDSLFCREGFGTTKYTKTEESAWIWAVSRTRPQVSFRFRVFRGSKTFFLRARRKAGDKRLLMDDETFQKLLESLQHLGESQTTTAK